MRIQPIVEGHGEVAAVPVLLRRLRDEAGAYGVEVGRPIRQRRSQLVQEASLKTAVRLARLQQGCDAILILFDADDDCPKTLAPMLDQWARAAASPLPCAVVMATREYEAWYLAAVESLRGKCAIREDAVYPGDPESRRGAKEALEELMGRGQSYHETTDQPALSAWFDMQAAYGRCRSFRRMVKAFGDLARGASVPLGAWPPARWPVVEGGT